MVCVRSTERVPFAQFTLAPDIMSDITETSVGELEGVVDTPPEVARDDSEAESSVLRSGEQNVLNENVHRILNSSSPDQGTREWLEWRRTRLTASDIEKVLRGRSSSSFKSLKFEKAGWKLHEFVGNKYTSLGHQLESEILHRFGERYGCVVHTDLRPVEHPHHCALAASLDGVTFAYGGANVEAKLIFQDYPIEAPKSAHVSQVKYQMFVTGLQRSFLCYMHYNCSEELEDGCYDMLLTVFEIAKDEAWERKNVPLFGVFIEELHLLLTQFTPLERTFFDIEYIREQARLCFAIKC